MGSRPLADEAGGQLYQKYLEQAVYQEMERGGQLYRRIQSDGQLYRRV